MFKFDYELNLMSDIECAAIYKTDGTLISKLKREDLVKNN